MWTFARKQGQTVFLRIHSFFCIDNARHPCFLFTYSCEYCINYVYNTHIQNLASDPEYAGTLEIKSYPFSNENYLQIVSTLCEFPVYGTDGQIYSYNYDIKNNTAITLDEIVAKYNITDQDLLQSISTKFKPESETRQITLIEPAAFRIISDDEAEIYVYVHSDDPNSTPDSRIWKYNTKSKGCSQYNGTALFSADVPDQMNPPLLYQQN